MVSDSGRHYGLIVRASAEQLKDLPQDLFWKLKAEY